MAFADETIVRKCNLINIFIILWSKLDFLVELWIFNKVFEELTSGLH